MRKNTKIWWDRQCDKFNATPLSFKLTIFGIFSIFFVQMLILDSDRIEHSEKLLRCIKTDEKLVATQGQIVEDLRRDLSLKVDKFYAKECKKWCR